MSRTSISYEIFENYAYGICDTSVRGGFVALNFTPALDGYVLIGNLTFDIKGGCAQADLRALDDGEHKVRVCSDNKIICADKITKSGNIIALTPPTSQTGRGLTGKLIAIKRELISVEGEVAALREKIESASVL